MAELAAYTNAPKFSATLTAVAVVRGVRLTMDSSNLYSVSAISVRGDLVASVAGAASECIACYSLQTGSIVAMVANEAIAVGDDVFSAAIGKVSTTSGGGAVLLGKANTAASGDNILFEVLLQNPA